MLKRIFKYLFYGISSGCTLFVLLSVIGVAVGGEEFLTPVMDNYIQHASGSAIVGICCGSTAIVYTFENLAWWKCVVIHFAVGLAGYFLTAFRLGWIPVESGIYGALSVLLGMLIFTGIWSCFYGYNRYEAKKVNQRLKEMEQDKNNDD